MRVTEVDSIEELFKEAERVVAAAPIPLRMSEKLLEQLIGEAVVRVGEDQMEHLFQDIAKRYGWPLPAQRRAVTALIVKSFVQSVERYRQYH